MIKTTTLRPFLATVGILIVLGGLITLIYALNRNSNESAEENPTVDDNIITNDTEVVVEDLDIPWDMVFLPDDDILITQREGTLIRVSKGTKEVINIQNTEAVGEGGLLGIALHPEFESNELIYLYMTTRTEGTLVNRVDRYKLEGNQLQERTTIVENIPGGQVHDGGMIRFGPDGKLYISTGDAGNSSNAQNLNSLGGKILRVNNDGSVPSDNPFDNSVVYSYGHRNVQGIAWDDEGTMWVTEHGRSGISSGFDEINKIEAGNNYGWPNIQGDETEEGLVSPILQSGESETWAPAGLVYYNNNLIFAGLRGQTLYKLPLDSLSLERKLVNEYGRLRAVVLGPDGYLYISTSNLDGRGNPKQEDDKIIKIDPESL